jgi:CopG family nickel-responsive transcriptional regulator
MTIKRFGISLDGALLKSFDKAISRKGYTNRSEAIRDLIRDSLVREEWKADAKEAAGVVTIVYSHHARELADTLMEMQHVYCALIVSTMHIHLDGDNCLEVIVVRGCGKEIREVADRLIAVRGVKHGQLTVTGVGIV